MLNDNIVIFLDINRVEKNKFVANVEDLEAENDLAKKLEEYAEKINLKYWSYAIKLRQK